jgi:hypothetical protein
MLAARRGVQAIHSGRVVPLPPARPPNTDEKPLAFFVFFPEKKKQNSKHRQTVL